MEESDKTSCNQNLSNLKLPDERQSVASGTWNFFLLLAETICLSHNICLHCKLSMPIDCAYYRSHRGEAAPSLGFLKLPYFNTRTAITEGMLMFEWKNL